jgi:hypothetical protein
MSWGLRSLVSLAVHNVQYVLEDPAVVRYWKEARSGKNVTLPEWQYFYKSIEAGTTRYQKRNVEKDLSKSLGIFLTSKL